MRSRLPVLLLLLFIGSCARYLTDFYYPPYHGHFWALPVIREGNSRRISGVRHVPAGERLCLAEIKGAGVISHLWFTLKHSSKNSLREIVLRIWWDNEPYPSVEVPLGDFFGVGFAQERNFRSLMLDMTVAGGEHRSALNCYFPMPFGTAARLEIDNQSHQNMASFFWQIDYEELKRVGKRIGRFHAQWRRENPVKRGVPYTLVEAEGEGHYVGTIFNVRLLEPGAWVEGGDDFYIDGEVLPTLPGIGGEDYFGQSWGYRFEYNNLLHGTSLGPQDGLMTAYRFHVPDPIRFQQSLRATMRCHGWDVQDREDDYSSVAFWYQREPHVKFPQLPPPAQRYVESEPSMVTD